MIRIISILVLVSLAFSSVALADINAQVAQLDIGTSTKGDAIAVFGEPIKYIWGEHVFDPNALPERYIIVYPKDFQICIMNNLVVEIRFEGPSDYIFGNGFAIGSSDKKAVSVLGRPAKVISGKPNGFQNNTFYKNIDGKKGFGYYARPDKEIRIWLENNKVSAIYLSGSSHNKAKPKISRIDELRKVTDYNQSPVGIWQSVDIVKDIEDFTPDQKRWAGELPLGRVKFYKQGRIWGRTSERYQQRLWSNGMLWTGNPADRTRDKYLIKEIDGSKYMFIERMRGRVVIGEEPDYYVLKKEADEQSKLSLATDQNPIGVWQRVDFVMGIEDFTPGKMNWTGKGKGSIGTMIFYPDGKTSMAWTWTNGALWDPVNGNSSNYVIMESNDSKYMFMEWMSGDVARGIAPCYYVLQKMADEIKMPSSLLNRNGRSYRIPSKITPYVYRQPANPKEKKK